MVAESPFEEISDGAFERAKELISTCSRVINAGLPIGPHNLRMRELLEYAGAQGKLEVLPAEGDKHE